MKITRERKIIGSILLLALAGFGYDHVTSSAAATTDTTSADELLVGGSHKTAIMSNAAIDDQSLASRFAQLASCTKSADIKSMRDVFHPTAGWLDGTTASTDKLSDSTRAEFAQKFTQSHHLTAISNNARGGGVAIVDGKILRVGAKLDGFTLVAISHQNAEFDAGNGTTIQLRLTN